MKMTNYTDYSMRVLIYLATINEDKLANINEIAEVYNISKNHLMKIIYNLGKMGYILTIRGRNGGIRLAKPANEINIGEVIRKTEDDFTLVECFGDKHDYCILSPICSLKGIFNNALSAFFQVLDQYTLEDVIQNKQLFKEYLQPK